MTSINAMDVRLGTCSQVLMALVVLVQPIVEDALMEAANVVEIITLMPVEIVFYVTANAQVAYGLIIALDAKLDIT